MNKRLKMLFAIVNQVKGFIRKITQAFPITLKDCVDEDSLINMSIEGNCYQDGEPTYDNPIEIQAVGEKTANILVYPYLEKSKTTKGITYTVNDDGSIAISGTSDSNYAAFTLTKDLQLTVGKTYILKNDCSVANLYFKFLDETGKAVFRGLRNGCISTIWQEGYTFEGVYAQVNSAGTVVDETMHPMLIEADCTSDDNLLPYPYKDVSKTLNGIAYTDNGDGTITLDGTYTGSSTAVDFQLLGTSSAPIEFPPGTYFLTGCPLGGGTLTYRIIGGVKTADTAMGYFNDVGNGYVFEVPEGGSLWLSIRIGADLGTVSGLTFRPCITKVDGYEPYGYKIPIVAETENLFVEEHIVVNAYKNSLFNGEGVKGYGQNITTQAHLKQMVRPNRVYTMSFDIEMLEKGTVGTLKNRTYGLSIYSPDTKIAYLKATRDTEFNVGEKQHLSVTATLPDNMDDITLYFYLYTGRYVDENGATSDSDTIRFTNIKIEEEDHETEPIVSNVYAKEPLRGVKGDFIVGASDVLDIKNRVCTRNLKESIVELKGFTPETNGLQSGLIFNTTLGKTKTVNSGVISEIAKQVKNTAAKKEGDVYEATTTIRFVGSTEDTLETLKAKYDGSKIVYILEEPITEKIIAPNIPTFKHGTTYSIATTVQPLSGTVEYYSTTKGV